MQYQAQADMSDTDDRLREIGREIEAIEAIRLLAVRLAPGLKGDLERIAAVWRGKDGLQNRIADALEPLSPCPAKYNRTYDEVCQRVWAVLWAGRL